MTKARWELKQADEQGVQALLSAGVHPLVARLLANRGVRNKREAEKFFSPSLEQLASSKGLADIEEATEVAVRAIRDKKRIWIYGDYDADGITATALAIEFLRSLGADCQYYIPDRQGEGYGLSSVGIKKISDKGGNLIVTADCGTTDAEEVDYARSLGIDVIVTDHHRTLGKLPDCPVVNPQRSDSKYPFKELAGVGVMLYLLGAVRKRLISERISGDSEPIDFRSSLDLVALGTVADVVPLINENRILVSCGLELLTNSTRPGIVALKDVSEINNKKITTYRVAFLLAPRINAAGRLDSARLAVELLLTQSPSEAIKLARHLNSLNSQRQTIESEILEEAKNIILEDPDWESKNTIVVGRDGWHQGVIGIVASKLSQEFYKPVLLVALDGDSGRGSGRCISEVDLACSLQDCSDLLDSFGGHAQAAGFSIKRDNLFDLTQAFEQAVKKQVGEQLLSPALWIDAYPEPDHLTISFTKELELFEPTGFGNPEPTLAVKECKIESKELRSEKHLKLVVNFGGFRFEAMLWNQGYLINRLGSYADIAFVPEIDKFWGEELVRWKVRAIRSTAEK